MNFLAHFLLAEGTTETLAGNFLGDFIKGRIVVSDFPPGVVQGIHTHRAVDAFADRHPVSAVSRRRFAPPYRRIAGIVVDIAYDHFLSRHWTAFADEEIGAFILRAYDAVETHAHLMPDDLIDIIPRMRDQDWLNETRSLDGLDRIFHRMSHRAPLLSVIHDARREVERNFYPLEADFLQFFPEVVAYVRAREGRLPTESEQKKTRSQRELRTGKETRLVKNATQFYSAALL